MAEAISTAGEEKVGELCCQLPRRDPEQASLPAAPSGHRQLRMLEAVVAPAVLDETTLSTGLPPRGPAELWMKWPPLRGQLGLPYTPRGLWHWLTQGPALPLRLAVHAKALSQRRPLHGWKEGAQLYPLENVTEAPLPTGTCRRVLEACPEVGVSPPLVPTQDQS